MYVFLLFCFCFHFEMFFLIFCRLQRGCFFTICNLLPAFEAMGKSDLSFFYAYRCTYTYMYVSVYASEFVSVSVFVIELCFVYMWQIDGEKGGEREREWVGRGRGCICDMRMKSIRFMLSRCVLWVEFLNTVVAIVNVSFDCCCCCCWQFVLQICKPLKSKTDGLICGCFLLPIRKRMATLTYAYIIYICTCIHICVCKEWHFKSNQSYVSSSKG